MNRTTPRAVAAEMERRPPPDTGVETFIGYGVMGLPFSLGHVLAFRRATASSIGPATTCVWLRDPEGRWTAFVDGDPHLACPRYHGSRLFRTVRTEIGLEWTGPWSLALSLPREQIAWALRLEARAATRAWSLLAGLLPRSAFLSQGSATLLGALAGRLLGTAPLRLQGTAPSNQWYAIRPSRLWAATAAAAVVRGRDLGPMGAHPDRIHLGEVTLPSRPLFMAGEWLYEPYDPDRHHREIVGAPAPDRPRRRPA